MAAIYLVNKTSNKAKEGYVAKVIKGGFDYCNPSDTPIGIVVNDERPGRNTLIKSTGTTRYMLASG